MTQKFGLENIKEHMADTEIRFAMPRMITSHNIGLEESVDLAVVVGGYNS